MGHNVPWNCMWRFPRLKPWQALADRVRELSAAQARSRNFCMLRIRVATGEVLVTKQQQFCALAGSSSVVVTGSRACQWQLSSPSVVKRTTSPRAPAMRALAGQPRAKEKPRRTGAESASVLLVRPQPHWGHRGHGLEAVHGELNSDHRKEFPS